MKELEVVLTGVIQSLSTTTSLPTQRSTQQQTQAPTQRPTQSVTQPQTQPPTQPPTLPPITTPRQGWWNFGHLIKFKIVVTNATTCCSAVFSFILYCHHVCTCILTTIHFFWYLCRNSKLNILKLYFIVTNWVNLMVQNYKKENSPVNHRSEVELMLWRSHIDNVTNKVHFKSVRIYHEQLTNMIMIYVSLTIRMLSKWNTRIWLVLKRC